MDLVQRFPFQCFLGKLNKCLDNKTTLIENFDLDLHFVWQIRFEIFFRWVDVYWGSIRSTGTIMQTLCMFIPSTTVPCHATTNPNLLLGHALASDAAAA